MASPGVDPRCLDAFHTLALSGNRLVLREREFSRADEALLRYAMERPAKQRAFVLVADKRGVAIRDDGGSLLQDYLEHLSIDNPYMRHNLVLDLLDVSEEDAKTAATWHGVRLRTHWTEPGWWVPAGRFVRHRDSPTAVAAAALQWPAHDNHYTVILHVAALASSAEQGLVVHTDDGERTVEELARDLAVWLGQPVRLVGLGDSGEQVPLPWAFAESFGQLLGRDVSAQVWQDWSRDRTDRKYDPAGQGRQYVFGPDGTARPDLGAEDATGPTASGEPVAGTVDFEVWTPPVHPPSYDEAAGTSQRPLPSYDEPGGPSRRADALRHLGGQLDHMWRFGATPRFLLDHLLHGLATMPEASVRHLDVVKKFERQWWRDTTYRQHVEQVLEHLRVLFPSRADRRVLTVVKAVPFYAVEVDDQPLRFLEKRENPDGATEHDARTVLGLFRELFGDDGDLEQAIRIIGSHVISNYLAVRDRMRIDEDGSIAAPDPDEAEFAQTGDERYITVEDVLPQVDAAVLTVAWSAGVPQRLDETEHAHVADTFLLLLRYHQALHAAYTLAAGQAEAATSGAGGLTGAPAPLARVFQLDESGQLVVGADQTFEYGGPDDRPADPWLREYLHALRDQFTRAAVERRLWGQAPVTDMTVAAVERRLAAAHPAAPGFTIDDDLLSVAARTLRLSLADIDFGAWTAGVGQSGRLLAVLKGYLKQQAPFDTSSHPSVAAAVRHALHLLPPHASKAYMRMQLGPERLAKIQPGDVLDTAAEGLIMLAYGERDEDPRRGDAHLVLQSPTGRVFETPEGNLVLYPAATRFVVQRVVKRTPDGATFSLRGMARIIPGPGQTSDSVFDEVGALPEFHLRLGKAGAHLPSDVAVIALGANFEPTSLAQLRELVLQVVALRLDGWLPVVVSEHDPGPKSRSAIRNAFEDPKIIAEVMSELPSGERVVDALAKGVSVVHGKVGSGAWTVHRAVPADPVSYVGDVRLLGGVLAIAANPPVPRRVIDVPQGSTHHAALAGSVQRLKHPGTIISFNTTMSPMADEQGLKHYKNGLAELAELLVKLRGQGEQLIVIADGEVSPMLTILTARLGIALIHKGAQKSRRNVDLAHSWVVTRNSKPVYSGDTLTEEMLATAFAHTNPVAVLPPTELITWYGITDWHESAEYFFSHANELGTQLIAQWLKLDTLWHTRFSRHGEMLRLLHSLDLKNVLTTGYDFLDATPTKRLRLAMLALRVDRIVFGELAKLAASYDGNSPAAGSHNALHELLSVIADSIRTKDILQLEAEWGSAASEHLRRHVLDEINDEERLAWGDVMNPDDFEIPNHPGLTAKIRRVLELVLTEFLTC